MAIFTPDTARRCLVELRKNNTNLMLFEYFDEEGNELSEWVDREYCQFIIGKSNLDDQDEFELYADWLYEASRKPGEGSLEDKCCVCVSCVRTIPEAAVLFFDESWITMKRF